MRRDDPRGALILDCVRGVRTPGAWEAVSKLLETGLQFSLFRNFRDLRVDRVGGIPGRAGRPGLAVRVLVPFGAGVVAHPPGVPCVASLDPELRLLQGPGLQALRSPLGSRVLFALAVHSRRIRAHGWGLVSDARRPCPNPDPSARPATFPHPSTLAPLPRDPGDRLVYAPSKWTRVSPDERKRKTGTNSAPFPGEAVGEWGGRVKEGRGRPQ